MMHNDIHTRKRRGRLGRDAQIKLGKTLQAYFDDVVKEGVPDRFKELAPAIRRTQGQGIELMLAGPVSARSDALGGAESARLCHFTERQCRPRRRPGAGDACCVPWRTSIRSSRAPTCRPGCSRSCATCSAPNTASAGARSRMPTAATPTRLTSHPEQHGRIEFEEFRKALSQLPPDQREALILVGASGFSYEEAAGDLRMRGRHHQEPRQPCPHPAVRVARDRQRRRIRPRPIDTRGAVGRRPPLTIIKHIVRRR